MPHVIVKLWPGKSEEQKRQLAEAIARRAGDRNLGGPRCSAVSPHLSG